MNKSIQRKLKVIRSDSELNELIMSVNHNPDLDYCYIPLSRGHYAVIDREHYEDVIKCNWECLVRDRHGNLEAFTRMVQDTGESKAIHLGKYIWQIVHKTTLKTYRLRYSDGDHTNCRISNLSLNRNKSEITQFTISKEICSKLSLIEALLLSLVHTRQNIITNKINLEEEINSIKQKLMNVIVDF